MGLLPSRVAWNTTRIGNYGSSPFSVTERVRPPAVRRVERLRDVHKDVDMDVLSESEGRRWWTCNGFVPVTYLMLRTRVSCFERERADAAQI